MGGRSTCGRCHLHNNTFTRIHCLHTFSKQADPGWPHSDQKECRHSREDSIRSYIWKCIDCCIHASSENMLSRDVRSPSWTVTLSEDKLLTFSIHSSRLLFCSENVKVDSSQQYVENAAARELFEFQVCSNYTYVDRINDIGKCRIQRPKHPKTMSRPFAT